MAKKETDHINNGMNIIKDLTITMAKQSPAARILTFGSIVLVVILLISLEFVRVHDDQMLKLIKTILGYSLVIIIFYIGYNFLTKYLSILEQRENKNIHDEIYKNSMSQKLPRRHQTGYQGATAQG